jgi:hypothetical protein
VAGPIRFRHSTETWNADRVTRDLYTPLDRNIGATIEQPDISPPPDYAARQISMDNGDIALFAWHENDSGAYWLGNTETPESLWRTDKFTFDEAPYKIARWAQRTLLNILEREEPWLAEYDHVTWFFLPVLFSKDGRDTTRDFFRNHAAGFPGASQAEGLQFYESALSTGVLDPHRYTMATKLGTSEQLDLVRMRASMAELNTAKLLTDAGYEFVPEVELDSGYALDFRVEEPDQLVEVTRPEPPSRRRAGSPGAALKDTVGGKTNTQLDAHDKALLFVDCTSFTDSDWDRIYSDQARVGYTPAIVYKMWADGSVAAYTLGDPPLDVGNAINTAP